jgi:hypothetical protein
VSAKYRLLARGVLELATNAIVTPDDPDAWAAWHAYLAAGLPVDPMATDAPPADRGYYVRAGAARKARELAALTDSDYLLALRKGTA